MSISCFQVHHCKVMLYNKHVLTNNSSDHYAVTLCIIFSKNNLFLARLLGISANWNENYRRYNFQSFANISGNFRKIYNPNFISRSDVVTCEIKR